jgi:hypothetical protein
MIVRGHGRMAKQRDLYTEACQARTKPLLLPNEWQGKLEAIATTLSIRAYERPSRH